MGNLIVAMLYDGIFAVFALTVLYFVIKWAVKNGIKEAYRDIVGKGNIEEYWKTF